MFEASDLIERLDSVRRHYARFAFDFLGAAEHADLLAEVAALGIRIEAARRTIVRLKAAEFHRHIPDAAQELEAIVRSTAEATDAILTTCEQLDLAVADLPEAWLAPIRLATTRIFEACSFQDITGQRAAKVERVLALVDSKVKQTELVFDAEPLTTDEPLLVNGPQRHSLGLKQGDVDALFGSLV